MNLRLGYTVRSSPPSPKKKKGGDQTLRTWVSAWVAVEAKGGWVLGCIPCFPCSYRLIESSLGSVATKLNFFIHNLAQMKFTGSDDRLTLSFAPRTHTLKSSGRIRDVFLCRHEKVFHPSKGYVSAPPL